MLTTSLQTHNSAALNITYFEESKETAKFL